MPPIWAARLPVLFVAVAYRGRALPLGWRMLPADGMQRVCRAKGVAVRSGRA